MITPEALVDFIKKNYSWQEQSLEIDEEDSDPQLFFLRVEVKVKGQRNWPVFISIFEEVFFLDSFFAPKNMIKARDAFRYSKDKTGFGIREKDDGYCVTHICFLEHLEDDFLPQYLASIANETSQIGFSIPGFELDWLP
jgi:hypothetical protein